MRRQRYSKSKHPPLVKLRYSSVYCELCGDPVKAGQSVAWWLVRGKSGRYRKTAYCGTCHHANIRAGRALQ